ncbi:MAG: glycosyltransferase family 2 protein [Acidobacteriota bacterium]
MISIVVPFYNEKGSLSQLYAELVRELELRTPDFEILFVDDGSSDGSVEVLESLQRGDGRIRVVRFRRNFGKSAALSAGFRHCRGEVIITLDADLQDRPHEIRKLLDRLEEGYDLVSGWRYRRRDPWGKRLASFIFNKVTALMTGLNIHDINCGLKAYRRQVIEEIRVYGEMHRYIPVLASYRGFRVGEVEVEHSPRRHGRSKYGAARMFGGFFDLLTVILLTRYSSKPLHIFGVLGVLLGSAGLGILAYLSVRWWMGTYIEGRPLFLLGVLLMIVGIQFILFGLLAEMIAYSSRREDEYSIRDTLPAEEEIPQAQESRKLASGG